MTVNSNQNSSIAFSISTRNRITPVAIVPKWSLAVLIILSGCTSSQELDDFSSSSSSEKVTLVSHSTWSVSKPNAKLEKILAWDGDDENVKAMVTDETITALKRQAQNKDANACFVLGRLFCLGYHVQQDDEQAVKFLKQAVAALSLIHI